MQRIERLQVTNHERWGKLVKTWATGTNYLDDDNEYPMPETMDEFKEQLAKAQVFATVPDRFKQSQFVEQEQDTITVKLPPKVMIEDSEALLNQPGRDLSASAVLQAPVQRYGSGDPGEREVQGACRTYRRLHDQRLRLKSRAVLSPVQWSNAFDRKPCATQAVAQGFPSLLDADGVRLQDPACDDLVGRRDLIRPRTSAVPFTKSLRFLARHLGLPELEQRSRTPCGQRSE